MGSDEAYWAEWFWRRSGGPPAYPADIGYAVTCALEVGIRPIAGLTTSIAIHYLRRFGISCPGGVDERDLYGCIAIGPSGGLVLVEEDDDESQRRFTVAHEASHYILEVRRHHRRAARRMGDDYVGVLYGRREATPTERIDAWLNDVRSSAITHFMDRGSNGGYSCGNTLEAECSADRLALEILAPRAEMVRAVLDRRKLPFRDVDDAVRRLAEQRFGLPAEVAGPYASRLVWELLAGPSTAERFGLA